MWKVEIRDSQSYITSFENYILAVILISTVANTNKLTLLYTYISFFFTTLLLLSLKLCNALVTTIITFEANNIISICNKKRKEKNIIDLLKREFNIDY